MIGAAGVGGADAAVGEFFPSGIVRSRCGCRGDGDGVGFTQARFLP